MNNGKNNKADEIIDSLDGIKRAAVPDFFYTRLLARMQKKEHESSPQNWMLRPVYIIAGLILILAVNIVVFLNNSDETTLADENDTLQQSIASEYSIADNNSIYDLNQDR
ncbi:MAG: hypothetical protein HZB42_10015 [Sphingobacteriales bacterium]|nr:hypothetical protein [Sphingobacteriales bacterium]